MGKRVHLRIVRPYPTEAEFLDAEAWTIARGSLFLIDAPPSPPGALVRCKLLLESGQVLIVAEGAVIKYLDQSASRPSGLVLQLQRIAKSSSEFIDRAVGHGDPSQASAQRFATLSRASQAPRSQRPSAPPPRRSGSGLPRATRSDRPTSGTDSGAPSVSMVPPATRSRPLPGPASLPRGTEPSLNPLRSPKLPQIEEPSAQPPSGDEALARLRTRSRHGIHAPDERAAVLSRLRTPDR